MGLFQSDFVPEMNTKNLRNSPNFLTVTHTTRSAKWFRCYGIINDSDSVLDSDEVIIFKLDYYVSLIR
jgi:hypothetical protein